MRKHVLQIITLIFCAVLLVMNIRQSRKLEELENRLASEISNQNIMLNNDIQGIASRVEQMLEEGARLVADYGLEPVGLDKTTRSLQAEAVVTLKEWGAETAVDLVGKLDGKESALPMTASGSGEFTCMIEVPAEQNCELSLAAVINSGGVTRREELGAWSELSMLLPVRMHSWGGSAPVYEDGFLSIGHHDGDLEARDGSPAKVTDVCYRLYVNGEKVKEEKTCENWLQECTQGDEVRITLSCRDQYGLGYEFTMMEFVCDENANDYGTANIAGEGTVSPILSWD